MDFEKAFDKIEYGAILRVLKAMGFGEKWCEWIKCILNSATSHVLLNGIPSKMIHCKRDVRQGDPLSPILFVIVVDLLQTILNFVMHHGQLTKPIRTNACPDFPTIQYADDTLIIMQADPSQLILLQDILQQFHTFIGLKVNFHKSNLIHINL